MTRLILALAIGWLAATTMAQEQIPLSQKSTPATAPKTDSERGGYAIGLGIGKTLQAQGLEDLDLAFLVRGIRDSLSGVKPALGDEERQEVMHTLQKNSLARIAARNKAEGEKYLAANAKKEGVKTTKSGLQYKVLKEGKGPSPKPTDVVRTHYHGTFVNGEVFDSSVERSKPEEFEVNGVIPAWTEALQMMKVGSKWQLAVPCKLAYGEKGYQGIPPNTALVFEVELLEIMEPATKSK